MKKSLILSVGLCAILAGCSGHIGEPPLEEVPQESTFCQNEKDPCLMEDGVDQGVCDQNLICLDCEGLNLSQSVSNQETCTVLTCVLNGDNIKFGHLLVESIEGCVKL